MKRDSSTWPLVTVHKARYNHLREDPPPLPPPPLPSADLPAVDDRLRLLDGRSTPTSTAPPADTVPPPAPPVNPTPAAPDADADFASGDPTAPPAFTTPPDPGRLGGLPGPAPALLLLAGPPAPPTLLLLPPDPLADTPGADATAADGFEVERVGARGDAAAAPAAAADAVAAAALRPCRAMASASAVSLCSEATMVVRLPTSLRRPRSRAVTSRTRSRCVTTVRCCESTSGGLAAGMGRAGWEGDDGVQGLFARLPRLKRCERPSRLGAFRTSRGAGAQNRRGGCRRPQPLAHGSQHHSNTACQDQCNRNTA